MNLHKAVLVRNLALCFFIVTALLFLNSQPVAALSVSDYFTLSYNITISTYNINEGQTFNAIASGSATYKAALPVSVSAAVMDSRVIATNQSTGAEVTLNSDYELNISPFPNKVGQTLQLTQTIPLIFPVGSPTGSYHVTGELISAKVDAIIWVDVSGYLPSSQDIGIVNYFAKDSTTTTTTPPTTTTTTTTTIIPPPITTTTTTTISTTTPTVPPTTTTNTTTTVIPPPITTTTTTTIPTTTPTAPAPTTTTTTTIPTTTTATTPTTSAISTTATSTASSPNVANLSSVIDSQGVFTQPVTFTFSDGLVSLDIPSGTVGLTAKGTPLTQISVLPVASPPSPPSGDDFIGLAYDFEPSGATFNPAIYMQFTYNPANIPTGISENNLVVAFYSTSNGQWITVPAAVDPVSHSITAHVSHFTTYTVMYLPTTTFTSTLTIESVLRTTSTTITTSPTQTKIYNGLIIADVIIIAVVVVFVLLVILITVRRKK